MKFGEKKKLGNGSNESKVFFENGTGIRRQHWDRTVIVFCTNKALGCRILDVSRI